MRGCARPTGRLRASLGEQLVELRHERIVADPRAALAGLCRFLGVEAPEDYLEACASVVRKAPRRTRFDIDWPVPARARVEALIAKFPFLHGYGFED